MKPSQILACILSVFIVLAAVCWLGAGRSSVVRIPTLASVFDIHAESSDSAGLPESANLSNLSEHSEFSESSVPADTVPVAPTDTVPVAPPVVELPKALPQTQLYLPLFYSALSHADDRPVRIVHFGDSQIEEDRISMIIRRRLQDRFGGGGIGLVPMVQTIPTYTAKQTLEQNGRVIPNSYVRRYLSYGPSSMRLKDSNAYGPMTQVAYVDQPVDVTLELLRDRVPTYPYDRIRVLCSDSVTVRFVSDSLEWNRQIIGAPLNDSTPSAEPMRQEIISLAQPRRSSLLHFEGKGYVYGISLETAKGVQVDNIPMRGAAGTNFTMMSRSHFAAYFRHTHTALVIMQFGGNAMPAIRTQAAVDKYVQSMRYQIRFVMAAAPDASLLFIGPSDMITTIDGELQTYPMLSSLDRSLAAMVAEEGGAYYSLFRLMGGAGSMVAWRDKGLAGEDMVHFTRAGAKKVGEMLAKQLLEDYDFIAESQNAIVESLDTITRYPNDSINE